METSETPSEASQSLNDKSKKVKPNRNESEKRRRDTFNYYVKVLATMVPESGVSKLDKSTILQKTYNTLKLNNTGSKSSEVAPFLTAKELGQFIFEGLDGFLFIASESGEFMYLSDSVRSILGYSVDELISTSLFDLIHPEDKVTVNEKLFDKSNDQPSNNVEKKERTNKVCKMRIRQHESRMQSSQADLYLEINCAGMLSEQSKLKDLETQLELKGSGSSIVGHGQESQHTSFCLVAICCLQKPTIVARELSNQNMPSFVSLLSLDGKYEQLGNPAVSIIGYSPSEVIGKSMYQFIHKDDINRVASAHTKLLESGESTSCTYRFLTKGKQMVWIFSKYKLVSKNNEHKHPDHVECINTVCSSGPSKDQLSSKSARAAKGIEAMSNSSSDEGTSRKERLPKAKLDCTKTSKLSVTSSSTILCQEIAIPEKKMKMTVEECTTKEQRVKTAVQVSTCKQTYKTDLLSKNEDMRTFYDAQVKLHQQLEQKFNFLRESLEKQSKQLAGIQQQMMLNAQSQCALDPTLNQEKIQGHLDLAAALIKRHEQQKNKARQLRETVDKQKKENARKSLSQFKKNLQMFRSDESMSSEAERSSVETTIRSRPRMGSREMSGSTTNSFLQLYFQQTFQQQQQLLKLLQESQMREHGSNFLSNNFVFQLHQQQHQQQTMLIEQLDISFEQKQVLINGLNQQKEMLSRFMTQYNTERYTRYPDRPRNRHHKRRSHSSSSYKSDGRNPSMTLTQQFNHSMGSPLNRVLNSVTENTDFPHAQMHNPSMTPTFQNAPLHKQPGIPASPNSFLSTSSTNSQNSAHPFTQSTPNVLQPIHSSISVHPPFIKFSQRPEQNKFMPSFEPKSFDFNNGLPEQNMSQNLSQVLNDTGLLHAQLLQNHSSGNSHVNRSHSMPQLSPVSSHTPLQPLNRFTMPTDRNRLPTEGMPPMDMNNPSTSLPGPQSNPSIPGQRNMQYNSNPVALRNDFTDRMTGSSSSAMFQIGGQEHQGMSNMICGSENAAAPYEQPNLTIPFHWNTGNQKQQQQNKSKTKKDDYFSKFSSSELEMLLFSGGDQTPSNSDANMPDEDEKKKDSTKEKGEEFQPLLTQQRQLLEMNKLQRKELIVQQQTIMQEFKQQREQQQLQQKQQEMINHLEQTIREQPSSSLLQFASVAEAHQQHISQSNPEAPPANPPPQPPSSSNENSSSSSHQTGSEQSDHLNINELDEEDERIVNMLLAESSDWINPWGDMD